MPEPASPRPISDTSTCDSRSEPGRSGSGAGPRGANPEHPGRARRLSSLTCDKVAISPTASAPGRVGGSRLVEEARLSEDGIEELLSRDEEVVRSRGETEILGGGPTPREWKRVGGHTGGDVDDDEVERLRRLGSPNHTSERYKSTNRHRGVP